MSILKDVTAMEEINRANQHIEDVLNTMDVPDLRKNLDYISNVRWLLRNIRIRNGDHPSCQEIIEHLQNLERKIIQGFGRDTDGTGFRF